MIDLKENYKQIRAILKSTLTSKEKQDKISELLSDRILFNINNDYLTSIFLKLEPFLNPEEINIIFRAMDYPDINLNIDSSVKRALLDKIFKILNDLSDDMYFKLSMMQLESFSIFYSELDILNIYFKCAFKTLTGEDNSLEIINEISNLYLIRETFEN